MNFVLQTQPLEHLAGVKIVTDLWNRPDILTQMARSFSRQPVYALSERSKEYEAMEEKVTRNVWALSLPETCRKNLVSFIKPLGMEIVHWCHYHTLESNTSQVVDIMFPPHFCWSMHGTLDYAKSAELIVKDDRLSIEKRYEVACLNCLENEARELIKSIPADGRRKCINKVRNNLGMAHRGFVLYFTCILSGDEDQLQTILLQGESIHKHLFKVTLRIGNRAASEYFFAKLSRREKRLVLGESLKNVFGKCRLSALFNLLYYLLLMNEEEHRHMFPMSICGLLQCFLHWPMQSLFVETARRGWQFMKRRQCTTVLAVICDKIGLGFQDYDYSHLFCECWHLTSVDDQRLLLADVGFLKCVLKTKREELLTFILSQLPSHLIADSVTARHNEIKRVLMDESLMSDAALMEFKQNALLNSSNDKDDVEKRLRNRHVS